MHEGVKVAMYIVCTTTAYAFDVIRANMNSNFFISKICFGVNIFYQVCGNSV